MSTYSLDLFFMASELPGPPIAHIWLKTFTRVTYGKDEYTFLSPECVTLSEVQYQVRRLKEELDEIEKRAGAEFGALNRRGKGAS